MKTENQKDAGANGPGVTEAVRAALMRGDVAGVHKLLARPYALRGAVVPGKGLGRQSGMPTANIRTPPGIPLPAHGVYATLTRIENGDGAYTGEYRGLTHIGARPSVDSSRDVTIETYLFDFSGSLYSINIVIEFYLFIRETRKFNSLDEVKAQVDRDAVTAIAYFNEFMRARRPPEA